MNRILSLALILSFLAACHSSKETASRKNRQSEGAEEDREGRVAWELERQANPKTGKIPFMIHQKEQAFAATLPGNDLQRGISQVSWNFRGPWNVGGRTRAFAVDITNENILFAGAISG